MKGLYKKFCFLAYLLFYISIPSSAGVYEYVFSRKVFDTDILTAQLNNLEWTLSLNQENDLNDVQFGYNTLQGQYFKNSKSNTTIKHLSISTSSLPYIIKSVTIETSTNKRYYTDCWVTVGKTSNKYICNKFEHPPIPSENTSLKFEGTGMGTISIHWKQNDKSTSGYQFYIKNITIEYEDQLPPTHELVMSNVGYATFAAVQSYVLPQGLEGGIVSITGTTANVTFCYQPGDTVQSREALILRGNAGKYMLKTAFTAKTDKTNNLLLGALDNNTIRAKKNHQLFIFSLSTNRELGFYYQKGCQNGSFLKNIANKAYLELPNSKFQNSTKGFRLNIQPTGISPTVPDDGISIIHDINGKRLNSIPAAKGIFIINGKKRFIK